MPANARLTWLATAPTSCEGALRRVLRRFVQAKVVALLAASLLQNSGHRWGNQEHLGARTLPLRSRLAWPGAAGSTLGRPLNRLQNGCSASFLVEGGFDSHAPPPTILSSDSVQGGLLPASRLASATTRRCKKRLEKRFKKRLLGHLPGRSQVRLTPPPPEC